MTTIMNIGDVKIAGAWELGWNTPIKEIDLWEYPLKDFGIDKLMIFPKSGIYSSFVEEYHDYQEIVNSARAENRTIIYVDENAPVELTDYVHPEKALYVMGRSSLSLFSAYSDPNLDQSVKIKTVKDLGALWSHQAISIILYDRYIKMIQTAQ